jgi:hypothetical protein
MPTIFDIARNLRKTVMVGDMECPVRGLNVEELTGLLQQFPELQAFVGGRGRAAEVNIESMIAKAPEAFAVVIATSLTDPEVQPTDEEIAAAKGLPGAVVMDFVMAIAELSLPRAIVSPFVAIWAGLGDSMAAGAAGAPTEEPATK